MPKIFLIMNTIKVKDKFFAPYIPQEKIEAAIRQTAQQINDDYKDKNPLFLVVLTGAFMFAGELMKHVNIPCRICFIKLTSYSGTTSTEEVKQILGLTTDVENEDIIIVEDIVDTGNTMKKLTDMLLEKKAKTIEICSMLSKPDVLQYKDMKPKYVSMEIPNEFILGYGLDYYELGRNLKDIYKIQN